jgi:hypothetical protein
LTKLRLLFLTLFVVGLTPLVASAAPYGAAPEGYAPYEPQTKCRRHVQPGTRELAGWIDKRYGGGQPVIGVRSCRSGGASEHKDGRAIDWMMDAGRKAHRLEVARFLDRIFATDRKGNAHARARRMGIMYVIWNDRMWASYDHFDGERYRSSSCKKLSKCSATLRHRDHVHISLSKAGGRAATSWYVGRG